MQVTITKIYRSDKDKAGKPLTTRDGRPYTKIAIKTQEHGDKWLSGFENRTTFNWKEGDKVEIDVEQKGEYLNFRAIPEIQKLWKAFRDLEQQLIQIKGYVGMEDNRPQGDEEAPF